MNRTEYLLTQLADECIEVAQRCHKALHFGLTETQPGQDKTNAQRIEQELQDFYGVVDMLDDEGIISMGLDHVAMADKKRKVEHFINYARKCGTVKP